MSHVGYNALVTYLQSRNDKSYRGFLELNRDAIISSLTYSTCFSWNALDDLWARKFIKEAERLEPDTIKLINLKNKVKSERRGSGLQTYWKEAIEEYKGNFAWAQLRRFAHKIIFYEMPEQIPEEYDPQESEHCGICQREILPVSEPITILCCGHLFHQNCFGLDQINTLYCTLCQVPKKRDHMQNSSKSRAGSISSTTSNNGFNSDTDDLDATTYKINGVTSSSEPLFSTSIPSSSFNQQTSEYLGYNGYNDNLSVGDSSSLSGSSMSDSGTLGGSGILGGSQQKSRKVTKRIKGAVATLTRKNNLRKIERINYNYGTTGTSSRKRKVKPVSQTPSSSSPPRPPPRSPSSPPSRPPSRSPSLLPSLPSSPPSQSQHQRRQMGGPFTLTIPFEYGIKPDDDRPQKKRCLNCPIHSL